MIDISSKRLRALLLAVLQMFLLTSVSAQTPSWGAFWDGNDGDHIVMDKYQATDAEDPWCYQERTFLRIRAWNTKRTTNNCIQLFFWIEDWDNYTTSYSNGIGPKEGSWLMNMPGVNYDYNGNPCWMLRLDGNFLNKCLVGYDPVLSDVCAYSSYGANTTNATDTYEGDWTKSDITSFQNYNVQISVGEDGNIYIEIGSPSELVATIGKKVINNSVFINLNTNIDYEDNTVLESDPYLLLNSSGSGSDGKDYSVQLRLNWNHNTGSFTESDIDFSQSYFRQNGTDIVCTAVSGTITETSPGTYQLSATLTGEDGTEYSVISSFAHCPKPEEFTGGKLASFSIYNDGDKIQIGKARFTTTYTEYTDNWYYDGVSNSRDLNKFWVIKATSNSQEHNYIQLYFWVDTDNGLYTYKDGYQCVKPGTYPFQVPQVVNAGSYYDYWTNQVVTNYTWFVDAQHYNNCALGFIRDSYWGVCPYSSYMAKGWSETFDPYYSSVTDMSMATIVVKEGKGGHIYIEIWVTPENGTRPVLAVTINEPKHAGVDTYQLNVFQTGNGKVEFPTQECNYVEGEEIVLTPSCEEGFEFDGWTGDCADQITDNGDGTYTFTMGTQDCSLTANCKEIKETVTVADNVEICSSAFPFVWRPWSNGGKGFEITSLEQSKTVKDEVKKDGVKILEDSIVTLNLTLHEPRTVPVEVKDTFWQCDYDLGDGSWINIVLDDGSILDIKNAIGKTYETVDEDMYGCDSVTLHEAIIIPEKVQRLHEYCQNELDLGEGNFINLVIDDRLTLEGSFWGRFSGDSIIRDTTASVYCEGFDSITIDTVRIYPSIRETWNPGICADKMEDALANGEISFYGTPITDLSQDGEEYYTDEGTENGCDYVIVLDLTPIPNDTVKEVVEIHKFPYTYKGQTFNSVKDTLEIITPQKGGCNMYTILIPDFTDTLKTEFYETGCSEYIWSENGKNYTESGNDTIFLRSYDDKLDSIVVLHLTIDYPKTGVDTTASACSSFVWYGTEYTTSGDYTKDLRSAAGCDSTVTLHLTIHEPNVTHETVTACEQYEWYGEPLTVSGDYKHTLPENANGCVDTIVLHLTIATPPAIVNLGTKTIAIGNAYTVFAGTAYEKQFDSNGTHTAIGKTAAGCDSIVNLTLVIIEKLEEDVYETICQGDKLTWNGKEYNTEGDYDYETVNAMNIDSIVHLHLTVNQPSSSEMTDTGCAPYLWFGNNYYESGDYEHHLDNAVGCDSTITLHLTIYPTYNDITDGITICQSSLPYTVNEVTFTESDAYTVISDHYKQTSRTMNLKTVNGCDSVVHFTLTVQTPTNETQNETACDNRLPFQWNPTAGYTQEFSDAGTYHYTLQSSLGCDSIYYTLNLTIDRDYVEAQPAMTQETCANDEALKIVLNTTTGTPTTFDITFDDMATAQGLANVSGGTVPADNVIAVNLPHGEDSTQYIRPDDYAMTLTVYDQCDRRTDYPMKFRILYPSWLIQQRWRDVLALYNEKYNGGYTFTNIRWYKDNMEISGNGVHNSYIQMSPVLTMGTYYALLTRTDDGKILRTCDFVPDLSSPYYVPAVDKIRLMQQLDSRHIKVQTDMSGTYKVYDVTGKQIMSGYFGEEYGNPVIVFSPATA
ncbi:MAG: hypothetical protein K5660_02240, partial [Paludibacteraceae bacterium]|nr:hypothetical protein [Paludibacteraceae bacterium]